MDSSLHTDLAIAEAPQAHEKKLFIIYAQQQNDINNLNKFKLQKGETVPKCTGQRNLERLEPGKKYIETKNNHPSKTEKITERVKKSARKMRIRKKRYNTAESKERETKKKEEKCEPGKYKKERKNSSHKACILRNQKKENTKRKRNERKMRERDQTSQFR